MMLSVTPDTRTTFGRDPVEVIMEAINSGPDLL